MEASDLCAAVQLDVPPSSLCCSWVGCTPVFFVLQFGWMYPRLLCAAVRLDVPASSLTKLTWNEKLSQQNYKHKVSTLHSLLHSYSINRKRLLNHLISLKTPPNLEEGKVFRSHFKLHSQQIVIAADKNIGFVCMDKSDYLLQYEKINLQQHFGQVNLSESAYITFIFDFLSKASTHIPYELSLLVKPSDFTWKHASPSIGVLRLMPKIL